MLTQLPQDQNPLCDHAKPNPVERPSPICTQAARDHNGPEASLTAALNGVTSDLHRHPLKAESGSFGVNN